jgi:hypothetical protein
MAMIAVSKISRMDLGFSSSQVGCHLKQRQCQITVLFAWSHMSLVKLSFGLEIRNVIMPTIRDALWLVW